MQISVTVEIHHVNHECSEGRSMYMYPFSWAPADEKNAAHEHDAGVHRRLTLPVMAVRYQTHLVA